MTESDNSSSVVSMMLSMRTRGDTSLLQMASREAVVVSPILKHGQQILSFSSDLGGGDVWGSKALVWLNDGDATLFEIHSTGVKHILSLQIQEDDFLGIQNSFVVHANGFCIKMLDFKGGFIQAFYLNDLQGKALHLDVTQDYMIVITEKSYIRRWNIVDQDNGFEQTGYSSCKLVKQDGMTEIFTQVKNIRCNSDGSKISFQLQCYDGHQHQPLGGMGSDGKEDVGSSGDYIFYVYDCHLDKVFSYSFSDYAQNSRHSRLTSHFWDDKEPRILACQTNKAEGSETGDTSQISLVQVTIFFVTSDRGIVRLEEVVLDTNFGLLGLKVPFITLFSPSAKSAKPEKRALPLVIERRTMRDFKGLENVDTKIKMALIEFHYNLAIGDVDGAYRSIEGIADQSLWLGIAQICVNTGRVAIALHCFAAVARPSASAYIHGLSTEPEEDVKVAAAAIQLDLVVEAQQTYAKCKHYDFLNTLQQKCGEWEQAVDLASKHDRVHLKSTLHASAKHLESMGRVKDAIHHYELAGTHRCEVPRMLHSLQRIDELHTYVDRTEDPVLQQWWGRYCEANEQLPQAVEYYTAAGDISSLVRVHCSQNDFPTAASLVLESSNAAAAFELAQQYERAGVIRQAIKFFTKSGKAIYGARLAMQHGIDNELMPLSLQSTKEMMLAAAKYYEDKDKHEEAVLLFHKGGDLEKAIKVCFRTHLFEALKGIADDLSEDANPALLAECGDFLMEHKQADKAVQLYIAAKEYTRALNVCESEGVALTEKMAEAMTPKPEEQKTPESKALFSKMAEVFNVQGSYHLACKSYTQAGDRLTGLKALLKSRDTERIIFFTNLSRQKEMYIMAANYLQSLDWQHDPNIMKTIIQMYIKADDMELLASFYEACAELEIDEFRDYEKALGAMKEALKRLNASRAVRKDDKIQALSSRIEEVERFMQVRGMVKNDPVGMISSCSEFLQTLSGEAAVRTGDVYALMIEFHHNQGNMEQAYQAIERMRAQKIPLGPYLDAKMVRAVYKAVGQEVDEGELEEDNYEDIEASSG